MPQCGFRILHDELRRTGKRLHRFFHPRSHRVFVETNQDLVDETGNGDKDPNNQIGVLMTQNHDRDHGSYQNDYHQTEQQPDGR